MKHKKLKTVCKQYHLCEDEPDVNHLDIGGLREAAGHADEQGRQHQQRCQVHRHSRPVNVDPKF